MPPRTSTPTPPVATLETEATDSVDPGETLPSLDAPDKEKKVRGGKKDGPAPETTAPKFFTLKTGDYAPGQPEVIVIYAPERDIAPGMISTSPAIRPLSYMIPSGDFLPTGIPDFKAITFRPGATVVPLADWNALAEYYREERTFNERLKSKALRVLKPKTEKSSLTTLDVLSQEDAEEAIANTYSKELLREWQARTKSNALSSSIERQVKAIDDQIEAAKQMANQATNVSA